MYVCMQFLRRDIGVKVYTCRIWPNEKMKRAVLFSPLFALSSVHPQTLMWNTTPCISRYAYDVNITLHPPLLIPFGVCSFITLSLLILRSELNWLSLPFLPRTRSLLLSDGSLFSRGFNVFTLAPGKHQINVTGLVRSETCVTSETRDLPLCIYLEYMTFNCVCYLDIFAPCFL